MKLLHLKISCCIECPFCVYDSHYDYGTDSGYDCLNLNIKVSRLENDNDENGFDTSKEIHSGCPLPNKGDE